MQSSGGGPVQQGGPLSHPTSPPPRCEVERWQRRPPGGGGDALVSVRGLAFMRAACCTRVPVCTHACVCLWEPGCGRAGSGCWAWESGPRHLGELAGRGRGRQGSPGVLRLQAALSLSAHTPGARTHFHGLR